MCIARWAVPITICLILAGSLSVPRFPMPSQAEGFSADVTAGKLVYEQHCQRCHGRGGWGDGPNARELRVPPANFHSPMINMKTDEQLVTSIEFGLVLSPMHAWRGVLGDQQMRDVVAYLRLLGQRGN